MPHSSASLVEVVFSAYQRPRAALFPFLTPLQCHLSVLPTPLPHSLRPPQVLSLTTPHKPSVQLRDVYETVGDKVQPTGDISLSGCPGVVCRTAPDLVRLAEAGMALRTTGATQMNDRSSRSHAIFQVLITQVTR